jgi:hypothetical protein
MGVSVSQEIIAMMNEISVPDVQKQRQGIVALESVLMAADQVEMPPEQLLHGGMYVRAVTVPAGTLLTGKIHKYDHIEIMASGLIAVTTDDGSARILDGFNVMPALTGKKRAAFAIEETVWISVTAVGDTGSLTPDEVSDAITVDTFDDLDAFYSQISNADYHHFIASQGWTEEQVQEIVTNEDDLDLSIDIEALGLRIDDSQIHGVGMFTDRPIEEGEKIMTARIGAMRTHAGRYINHAVRANSQFVVTDEGVDCVATKKIYAGEEITTNYRAQPVEVQ